MPHTHFVTSPVFGPPASAAAAQLLIVMSGDYRSKKEIAHILIPAVGRKAMDLGGNIEKGEPRFIPSYRRYLNAALAAPTFKLIGNSLILGSLELLAEVFTLSEKAGIGASQVQQFIKDTMPAPPLINYGEKMVQDNFDGSKGFAIDGGLKDSAHIRKLATELDSPMPALVGLMTRNTVIYLTSATGRCAPAYAHRAGVARQPSPSWARTLWCPRLEFSCCWCACCRRPRWI